MRYVLTCVLLLAISQSALAYRITNHPTKSNYRLVYCDNGAKAQLFNDGNVERRAQQICGQSERRSSSPTRQEPSRQEPSRQEPRRESSSSSSGSARCNATELPIESELDVGKRLGTISVPGTRPVTGTYMDVVCIEGQHRGKREQFQYRCGKNGQWQFVQRFWTRYDCRDDGRIAIR